METGEERSLKMSAVCTAVTNGVIAARISITLRKTTRTASPYPVVHCTETDTTSTITPVDQDIVLALTPITQEDAHKAAALTSDP